MADVATRPPTTGPLHVGEGKHRTSLEMAQLDPHGCREAIYVLASFYGWPRVRIAGVDFDEGYTVWLHKLDRLTPLQLSLVWDDEQEVLQRWADDLGIEASVLEQRAKTGNWPDSVRCVSCGMYGWLSPCVRCGTPREGLPIHSPGQSTSAKRKGDSTVAVIQPTKGGVDAGYYPCVIRSIEERDKDKDGKLFEFGKQLFVTFVVLDEAAKETREEIYGYCSMKWGPKAKLYQWAQPVLRSKCPSPDEPFDYDVLLGKKCDVHVGEYQRNDGSTGTKVVNLYPFRSMTQHDEEESG